MSEKLKLSLIRTDGGTQSRAGLNDPVAADYAELMRAGTAFPPLVVFHDGADYWLADGFHRHAALAITGADVADADVRQGTRRDAILFSVGANALHGLRRTNEDKRRAVTTLLEDAEWSAWSDREISRRAGVSNQFVSNLRSSVNGGQIAEIRTVERNGTTYQQNTAAIGKTEPHVTEAAMAAMRGTHLDTQEYWDELKKLPAGEQVAAVKRDLQKPKTAEEGHDGFDPYAIHGNTQQRIRDELPDAVKQIESARQTSKAKTKLSVEELEARIEELEETQTNLEADYAQLIAENKSFEAMRVQFEKGGFDEVIAGKDEEIRGLQTRLYSESQTAADWRKRCNFWKEQALKLGWKDDRFEAKSEALPDDDSFYEVVNGG